MIRLAENVYCTNGESQAWAHKWIPPVMFSWIMSLGMLVSAIGNYFISTVLLYLIMPPTKWLIGWRSTSTTFSTIY